MIIEYKHYLLTGKPCMIEQGFSPSMDLICSALHDSKCTLQINSSFRLNSDHITGAVVAPAVLSPHFIGHAIDGNLTDSFGNFWTNEMMLGELKEDVKDFIELIKKYNLRWGGWFHKRDAIHYDDGLNVLNPVLYKELYSVLHP